MMDGVKVALIHHWLTGMRGGEKVLEALCDLFPNADIFTLVCERDAISEKIRRHRITTSFVQNLPGSPEKFRRYLPLFPRAAARLDLSGYELVISSDASLVKAVRPDRGAQHICYCHSPPRYLWDLYEIYRSEEAGLLQRLAMPLVAPVLRRADFRAAQRVSRFIANSEAVAGRIRRHYGRESVVIHPPVDFDFFSAIERAPEDFYLFVGQLVAYKRADLAVQAFTRSGRRLVVVGDGPQRGRLESMAGPSVHFVGSVSDEVLRSYYGRCRALLFPNEEDFGIVPVEAQAAGAPVIALGRGGAMETVIDGSTGVVFEEESVAGLQKGIERFESSRFTEDACRANARRFAREVFDQRMREYLSGVTTDAFSEALA